MLAPGDGHLRGGYADPLGDKFAQSAVGPAVDRGSGEPDDEGAVVLADHLVTGATGAD
jgi:hypothetical protein